MDIVNDLVFWVRSSIVPFVTTLFNDNWFFACLIGFPVLRYFFKKFLKTF